MLPPNAPRSRLSCTPGSSGLGGACGDPQSAPEQAELKSAQLTELASARGEISRGLRPLVNGGPFWRDSRAHRVRAFAADVSSVPSRQIAVQQPTQRVHIGFDFPLKFRRQLLTDGRPWFHRRVQATRQSPASLRIRCGITAWLTARTPAGGANSSRCTFILHGDLPDAGAVWLEVYAESPSGSARFLQLTAAGLRT